MKKSAIIGLITIAICVGFLLTLNADTNTYSDFTQATSRGGEQHVVGVWDKSQPMHYDAMVDANKFTFYMEDQSGVVSKVIYKGTKPQDFERSEKLVLVGEMNDNTFYASKILMKCPSKYNDEMVEVNIDGTVSQNSY